MNDEELVVQRRRGQCKKKGEGRHRFNLRALVSERQDPRARVTTAATSASASSLLGDWTCHFPSRIQRFLVMLGGISRTFPEQSHLAVLYTGAAPKILSYKWFCY